MQKRKKTVKVSLVGETVLVVRAKNPDIAQLSGKIIDETKNTIKIQTKQGVKTLIKDQIMVKIDQHIIDGTRLVGRVEERVKK